MDINKKRFSFRIASDTSKEKAFIEIFYGGDQIAEISQEEPEPMLALLRPCSSAKYWEIPLEEALEAFQEAKNNLP